MIRQALSSPAGTVGFTGRTYLDTSAENQERTRLAVARAKQGDGEALRYLYITYSQNVYGYVRTIVRDEHEAEDVTQNVFAKLSTAILKYDERGLSSFFAWLIRLARNASIDHLRANRVRPTDTVFDPDVAASGDRDRTEAVRTALATLPEEQREVVVLRHVVGLTPGEIAALMGRTESAIHGLHHRGRRALQRELTLLESAPSTRSAAAQLVAA